MSDHSKMQPNQYTALALQGTSTQAGIDFGFNATYLRVEHRGDGEVFFTLASSVATTDDAELSSGETFSAQIPPTAMMGLATASSSTGTDKHADVFALGG